MADMQIKYKWSTNNQYSTITLMNIILKMTDKKDSCNGKDLKFKIATANLKMIMRSMTSYAVSNLSGIFMKWFEIETEWY